MKEELPGKIITEFSTLRPKLFCYLTDPNQERDKAKGSKSFS